MQRRQSSIFAPLFLIPYFNRQTRLHRFQFPGIHCPVNDFHYFFHSLLSLTAAGRYPPNIIGQLLQFAVGEFDIVVYDSDTLSCEIFEVKYSREVVPNQYRHLVDKEKCAETEHRFGPITGKYVIYRGEEAESEGIRYLNVEEYLKSLA